MAFLGGLKNSLKLDEMAGAVGAKMQGAKEFIHEKQQSIAESGGGAVGNVLQSVKDKAGHIPGADKMTGLLGNLGTMFPSGGGNRQSPIDILTSEARFDESLGNGSFQFNYINSDCTQLVNTGVSWSINCKEDAQSTLTAVHLPDTYRLRNIHCHWGTEPMNGSEHLVGGVGYAGEIHVVHWNTKYASFEEASKQADGLAVLAIFLNESHDDNPNLNPIINCLDRVKYKGDAVPMQGINLNFLLPQNKGDFWTYDGSLTTPPHTEAVVWTVFRSTIPISSSQLDKLRELYAVEVEDVERSPEKVAGNVRAVQNLNSRLLRASFRSGGIVPEANPEASAAASTT